VRLIAAASPLRWNNNALFWPSGMPPMMRFAVALCAALLPFLSPGAMAASWVQVVGLFPGAAVVSADCTSRAAPSMSRLRTNCSVIWVEPC